MGAGIGVTSTDAASVYSSSKGLHAADMNTMQASY